jgi:hypothetical protein
MPLKENKEWDRYNASVFPTSEICSAVMLISLITEQFIGLISYNDLLLSFHKNYSSGSEVVIRDTFTDMTVIL